MLGQSITWQPVRSPFTPDAKSAIVGGPGADPNPGTPMYLCRAQVQGSVVPGKWTQGECNFSDDAQKEQASKNYEVATGPAEWRNFDGNVGTLVPGGYAADGTHLYICRKQISSWGSNKGLQPGWLENGECHIPYNVDLTSGLPFEALYNKFDQSGKTSPQTKN